MGDMLGEVQREGQREKREGIDRDRESTSEEGTSIN